MNKKYTDLDLEKMRTMRKEGKSFREIGAAVGLKGSQSVKHFLEKYPTVKTEKIQKLVSENRSLHNENERLKSKLRRLSGYLLTLQIEIEDIL